MDRLSRGHHGAGKEGSAPEPAQEVPSGEAGLRVFVIDSEERRQYEEAMRTRAMEKTREKLAALQQRVARGQGVRRGEDRRGGRADLSGHHGYRYYSWELRQGVAFAASPNGNLGRNAWRGSTSSPRRKRTSTCLDAVQNYKDLTDVERGFRHLKDVLAVRPIWHRVEPRVRAHIFVAALALLLERFLERRLKEAGVDLSAPDALESVATIRLVTFHLAEQPVRRGVSGGCPRARQVLKALGICDLKPPTPPEDQTTVM